MENVSQTVEKVPSGTNDAGAIPAVFHLDHPSNYGRGLSCPDCCTTVPHPGDSRCPSFKNPHAVSMGRKGGQARSEAKTASGRANVAKALAARLLKFEKLNAERKSK